MSAYRTRLETVVLSNNAVANPGLVLDRYQRAPRSNSDALGTLLDRVCISKSSAIYGQAFEQWQKTILALPGVRAQPFMVTTRLIVGLGSESVRETGITLLKPYGVPYIPGSALKGLTRKYTETALAGRKPGDPLMPRHENADTAEKVAQNADNRHHVFFGDQQSAAYLTYFDAWYIPGSADGDRPLVRDVITVHHPQYYSAATRRPLGPGRPDPRRLPQRHRPLPRRRPRPRRRRGMGRRRPRPPHPRPGRLGHWRQDLQRLRPDDAGD